MKVACATRPMMEEFRDIYPDVFDLSEHLDRNDLDLLIFTGGADVNPALYGERPEGTNSWDDKRDKAETEIFNLWSNGRLRAKKILGVCRGIQMLNVCFGGNLYQDLADQEMNHSFRHEIEWQVKSPLETFTIVNSMHHQAIKSVGRGEDVYVLAYEPKTGIPEVVTWGSNVLAVQFHPEFFGTELKTKFFSVVNDWVAGKVNINSKYDRSPREKYYTSVSTDTAHFLHHHNDEELRQILEERRRALDVQFADFLDQEQRIAGEPRIIEVHPDNQVELPHDEQEEEDD